VRFRNLGIFTGAILLALSAGVPSSRTQEGAGSAAELMDAVMWNREPIGGPFALVDQDGRPRTDADFRGKVLLVYFGFTFCPDVCPADLQNIGLAMDRLGAAADAVQPLFVTLDPARDTAAHLKDYVALFHPRMVALTGDAAAIGKAADAYRVYYARAATKGDDYTVDHSAFIYLVDRDGKYLGFLPPGTDGDRIAEAVRTHLAKP
jgi:protein SCO1/2